MFQQRAVSPALGGSEFTDMSHSEPRTKCQQIHTEDEGETTEIRLNDSTEISQPGDNDRERRVAPCTDHLTSLRNRKKKRNRKSVGYPYLSSTHSMPSRVMNASSYDHLKTRTVYNTQLPPESSDLPYSLEVSYEDCLYDPWETRVDPIAQLLPLPLALALVPAPAPPDFLDDMNPVNIQQPYANFHHVINNENNAFDNDDANQDADPELPAPQPNQHPYPAPPPPDHLD